MHETEKIIIIIIFLIVDRFFILVMGDTSEDLGCRGLWASVQDKHMQTLY